MPDTTAKIRSKGLDATGVTEELAERMFAHKGKHYMAIVELKVDEIHDKTDGKQRVDLVITQCEPADDSDPAGKKLEDHLRELTRTMYYNRKVDDAQPTLPDAGGPDPKIGDVIGQGQALMVDEDQLAELEAAEQTDAEEDEGGDGPPYGGARGDLDVEDTDLPDDKPSNVVQFGFGDQATPDDQDGGQRDEPITDPHTYVDTANGLCSMCDQPAGHELHQAAGA